MNKVKNECNKEKLKHVHTSSSKGFFFDLAAVKLIDSEVCIFQEYAFL